MECVGLMNLAPLYTTPAIYHPTTPTPHPAISHPRCVGLMNLAVGRAHCEPVLPECTELALAGLELGLPELKEYAIVSIAIVSIAIVSSK